MPSVGWEQSGKSGLHVNTVVDPEGVTAGSRQLTALLAADPLERRAAGCHPLPFPFCSLTRISRLTTIYPAL